ncbi:MAG: hypothetical protein UEL26_14395 [Segatella copri]|nr:hypothetical protein [Segatella copri]
MENPLKLGSIAFIRSFEQKTTHSFMAPKSMSSEKENIELKSKEKNNTDKLNLSGQIVQQLISY